MLKTIEIQEAKNLVVHGRNGARRQPLTLFWTASGLEMNLHGSERAIFPFTNSGSA